MTNTFLKSTKGQLAISLLLAIWAINVMYAFISTQSFAIPVLAYGASSYLAASTINSRLAEA